MTDKYDGPERRRSKRIRADFIVIYRVNHPIEILMWVGSKEITAKMLDLSDAGMAIATNYDIPGSAILLIKFTLINFSASVDERVRSMVIEGEVKYNTSIGKNEYRLGVSFTNIAKEDQDAIANFVKTAIL